MPILTLQFEGRVLKEYAVGPSMTIGRLPDNTVVIDNPAVSAHHARVFRERDEVVVEDLRSTNGTFVNDRHVYRHALRDGDVVLVGKHKLVFDQVREIESAAAEPVLSGLGDTVYLDTRKHRELLATLRDARAEAGRTKDARPAAGSHTSRPALGTLRVVGGRAARAEYTLDAHTSLIGRSERALVRLHGWFKPDMAVAIARTGDRYVATPLAGRMLVNGRPVRGRHDLVEGDVLSVGGLSLEFRMRTSGSNGSAASAVRAHQAVSRSMSSNERAATCRSLT